MNRNLTTVENWRDWVFSLPGGPKVKLIEHIGWKGNGLLIVCVHRNHRRRFKMSFFRNVVPMGIFLKIKFVGNDKLKERFEVETVHD